MGLIRSYILSVIAASIICAISVRLAGARAPVIKLVASLFLAFTVMRPIVDVDLSGLIASIPSAYSALTASASDWETIGTQALHNGIQAQTEAYILREATLLGAQIDVEVELSEDDIPVPEAITIYGNVSPYQKAKLTHTLISGLGIGKEALIWS